MISIQKYGLIHADLNPENILVQFDENGENLESIKVIDFGSSLHFNELEKITAVQQEYLPPEVLEYIMDKQQNLDAPVSDLINKSTLWSLDVWSLAIIVLEFVVGFPAWMDLKSKCMLVNNKPRLF